jgi:hypothetical protein
LPGGDHSTGGRRDDGRGVLAVCTLYLYGSYSTPLVRWGEIGSILIREKLVRWRIVRKGCSAIVTLLLCGAAACDFPDLVVRLPCCCSRCGSPPTHSSASSSKWRRLPEHRQWGPRSQGQGAEPQTIDATRLSSARGSNCRPIGGTDDSQSRTHGASRMIWRSAGLWP